MVIDPLEDVMKAPAANSVAPIPTAIPDFPPHYIYDTQEAGDVGKRTLWCVDLPLLSLHLSLHLEIMLTTSY